MGFDQHHEPPGELPDPTLLESGEDLSIGYLDHDTDAVRLYLGETFSFRIATPEAAIALSP